MMDAKLILAESAANNAAKLMDYGTDALISHLSNGQRAIFVKNDLKKGAWIHCKDANTDFGRLAILPNETYFFTFWANFWGTSLYWCNLHTRYYYLSFDAYGDTAPYDHNQFSVRENGVYLKQNSMSHMFKGPSHFFDKGERESFDKDWWKYVDVLDERKMEEEENAARYSPTTTKAPVTKTKSPTAIKGGRKKVDREQSDEEEEDNEAPRRPKQTPPLNRSKGTKLNKARLPIDDYEAEEDEDEGVPRKFSGRRLNRLPNRSLNKPRRPIYNDEESEEEDYDDEPPRRNVKRRPNHLNRLRNKLKRLAGDSDSESDDDVEDDYDKELPKKSPRRFISRAKIREKNK